MARKRVKLQRILNDAQRRATFKKRLKGLTKKATELATLCGVEMCLIVYGEGAVEATEVWPSVPEATSVLERFKAMPDLDR
uniref:MADS-box domain-containing protein n=1 Tax=Leersia perrieri TaxID=77586 RepID=A0A0D9VEZ5_9ORYZ